MTELGGRGHEAASGGAGDPVSMEADRIKHLEFIQMVIARLSSNSFFIKGWALTLAAGLLAVSASQMSWQVAASGVIPLTCFWFLDGYFLRQEKLFRLLYDDARRPDTVVEVLSMDVRPYLTRVPSATVTTSLTLVLFYGALLTADLAFILITL